MAAHWQTDPASRTMQVRPDPIRVLLVEDDPDLRSYLVEYLVAAGCAAIGCGNGLEGWRAAESQWPNVVVLDLNMPVMSGFRLLQLLRRDHDLRHLPVIVTTGHDMEETMDTVRAYRPEAYLKKPFAGEQLLQHVHRLVPARFPVEAR